MESCAPNAPVAANLNKNMFPLLFRLPSCLGNFLLGFFFRSVQFELCHVLRKHGCACEQYSEQYNNVFHGNDTKLKLTSLHQPPFSKILCAPCATPRSPRPMQGRKVRKEPQS